MTHTHGSDGESLLRAILAKPSDQASRLTYADWLADTGDYARATFIRTQCALEKLASDHPSFSYLKDTQISLYRQHRDEFEGPLRRLGAIQVTFRGGLPNALTIGIADFLRNADEIFSIAPITDVTLEPWPPDAQVDAAWAERLALIPQLARLYRLSLDLLEIKHDGAAALARCPYLQHLNSLYLGANRLGDKNLAVLATAAWFVALHQLTINENAITDVGINSLGRVGFHDLRRLELEHNTIGPGGIAALCRSRHLKHVETLSLTSNPVSDLGAIALSRSGHFRSLQNLGLDYARLTTKGLSAICTSSCLPQLRTVSVIGNAVPSSVERDLRARLAARTTQARAT